MSWYQKHIPTKLDDFLCNKTVVCYLKNMIHTNNFTHFILSGNQGSGKRSLIKVFLNTVTTKKNVLWLNHLSLKTIESKDKLNSFLTSKTNENHKWLVIENLHKMSSQFLYTLYNILSCNSIIVCVLESNQSVDLSSWAITFNMSPPTPENLREIAKYIIKTESFRYNNKIVEKCITHSNNKLCPFLYFLQLNYTLKVNVSDYSHIAFSYDKILKSKSLKESIQEIYRLEKIGYSHMDIAIQLYRYVTNESKDIECALELGDAVEHLCHFEHDPYYLYASIAKIFLRNNIKISDIKDC